MARRTLYRGQQRDRLLPLVVGTESHDRDTSDGVPGLEPTHRGGTRRHVTGRVHFAVVPDRARLRHSRSRACALARLGSDWERCAVAMSAPLEPPARVPASAHERALNAAARPPPTRRTAAVPADKTLGLFQLPVSPIDEVRL